MSHNNDNNRALLRSLARERALAEIAALFNRTDFEHIDSAINTALQTIAQLSDADRSYLFIFSDDESRMSNTHEWCAQGIRAEIDNLQDLSTADFPYFMDKLMSEQLVYLPDINKIPNQHSDLKALLQAQDICSLIDVPLIWDGKCRGFIGLDAVKQFRYWTDDELLLLQTMADLFAGLLKRKDDELKLHIERINLSQLYENSPIMMHSFDRSGCIISVNQHWLSETGYEKVEVIGQRFDFIMTAESSQRALKQVIPQFWQVGKVVDEAFQYRCKNGNCIDVVLNFVVTTDAKGKTICLSTVRNVTEMVVTEQALQESRDFLQALYDASPDMIFVHDKNGRIIDANQNTLDGYGYSREAFFKKSLEQLSGADYTLEMAGKRIELARQGAEPDFEWMARKSNGTEFPIEVRLRCLHKNLELLSDGQPAIIALVRDISARKLAEANLKQSEERYSALFENIPNAVVVMDLELECYVEANRNAEQLYGLSREALLRSNPILLSPKYQESGKLSSTAAYEYIGQALQGESPVFEWQHINSNNEIIDCEIRLTRYPHPSRKLVEGSITDIRQRKQEQAALALADSEWKQAMDQSSDAIYLLDLNRHLIRANKAFYQYIDKEPREAIGEHIVGLTHPDVEPIACPLCAAQEARREGTLIMESHHPSNFMGRPIEVSLQMVRDTENQPTSMLITIHDLSKSRQVEEQLRVAASVFENSLIGILVTDADNRIKQVNQAFCQITGYTAEELIGETPKILKSEQHPSVFYQEMWNSLVKQDKWEGEMWNRRKDGEVFPVWESITVVKNARGKVEHYIASMTDITEQKLTAERITRLAHYDIVTGLPNRTLLNDRALQAVKHARRENEQVAIMFLDLDRFKYVNDSLGHHIGDLLLHQVALRLNEKVRDIDTVGRLGGDEFLVIAERIKDHDGAERIAKKLLQAFQPDFEIEGHSLSISTSIGISLYPEDSSSVATLIQRADTAMYQAKDRGRNNYRFFEKRFSEKATKRLTIETELRRAIEQDQLRPYFQPQYTLNGDERILVGAEALVRWQHPKNGLIGPGEFLPVAEETGLIVPLSEWMLFQSCRKFQYWREQGLQPGVLAVNIDGQQIQRSGLVELVKLAHENSGLPYQYLELEITESYIMHQAERDPAVLKQLRDLGVSVAIDDFGTGQSSLTYLKHLPLNKIKIDRSFIMDIPQDINDIAITRAILAMSSGLGLITLAEGVENREQEGFLKEQGCRQVQGFLYDKPITEQEFENLLRNR